jgi:hypothetical protein
MSAGDFKPVEQKPPCHHIWVKYKPVEEAEDSSGLFIHRRYFHECPKCHMQKTTTRKLFKK